jgi:hypothetical protein
MTKKGRPRTYLPPETARAIYLAGAGESASNIADLIGDTTPARVRALLSDYGVPLLHRRAGQTAMVILIRDENAAEIARLAADKGFAPAQFVGAMIDNVFAARRGGKTTGASR